MSAVPLRCAMIRPNARRDVLFLPFAFISFVVLPPTSRHRLEDSHLAGRVPRSVLSQVGGWFAVDLTFVRAMRLRPAPETTNNTMADAITTGQLITAPTAPSIRPAKATTMIAIS